ncbi:MAG: DUF2489 domain-containing protein [Proteobacteria bacterium]|nr:DUF2489 domain-containing protein [Pseudomonadota bacterium]
MIDHIPHTEEKLEARREVVSLCNAMLAGDLSFFEGAIRICSLRGHLGVPDDDSDITAFVAIESETDHLPMARTQHLWSSGAVHRLQPEFQRTEEWAKGFAPNACRNLIERFGTL